MEDSTDSKYRCMIITDNEIDAELINDESHKLNIIKSYTDLIEGLCEEFKCGIVTIVIGEIHEGDETAEKIVIEGKPKRKTVLKLVK